jgi:holliday junction DNA helicase RuvA
MYAYIKGKVTSTAETSVVIEAGGIGYEIFASTNSISKLDKNEAMLFTHFVVKEDSQTLYGFYTQQEKDMFKKLISISGIGPKVGMSILSSLSVSALATAIISSDIKAFEPVSGVGKKTAERIVLELRGKVSTDAISEELHHADGGAQSAELEAINALISLGYDRNVSVSAISRVKNLGDTTEDLILLALKRLG